MAVSDHAFSYMFKIIWQQYTVKKGYQFSRPQAGCHWPNSPCAGIIKFFPTRKSLVSDIPAGDGKIEKKFYSVGTLSLSLYFNRWELQKSCVQYHPPQHELPPPLQLLQPPQGPQVRLYTKLSHSVGYTLFALDISQSENLICSVWGE